MNDPALPIALGFGLLALAAHLLRRALRRRDDERTQRQLDRAWRRHVG